MLVFSHDLKFERVSRDGTDQLIDQFAFHGILDWRGCS
jgi:hypothetical protein